MELFHSSNVLASMSASCPFHGLRFTLFDHFKTSLNDGMSHDLSNVSRRWSSRSQTEVMKILQKEKEQEQERNEIEIENEMQLATYDPFSAN